MATDWKKPQPAPRRLWLYLHGNFPQTVFLGIYNPRNVAGTKTPSAHAEGRALDVGLRVTRPAEKGLGDGLFKLFIKNSAELGLDHIIWNKQIWSAAKGGPRSYTGVSPHTDHIHMAFTRAGSQRTSFPITEIGISVLRTDMELLAK